MIPSRAESFHGGFLGGKARRIALDAVGLGIAIFDFSRGEYAVQKPISEAGNRLCDTWNFSNVDAGTNNHGSIVNFRLPIANRFVRFQLQSAIRKSGCFKKAGLRGKPSFHPPCAPPPSTCAPPPDRFHQYEKLHFHGPPASRRPACGGSGNTPARR